jgi:DNA-binding Xre family transcriptional regulator
MSKLKQILSERGMTQIDLYERIRVMSNTPIAKYMISRIVSGKVKTYNVSTLMKICRALDVTPNQVLSKADYPQLFKDNSVE